MPNHGAFLRVLMQVLLKYVAARPLWWIAVGLYNLAKQTCTSKASCAQFDNFPGCFMLHVSHSLLFCRFLNRSPEESSSALRGRDKLACNPPSSLLAFSPVYRFCASEPAPRGPVMRAGPSARSAWFIVYLYCSQHLQSSPLRHALKIKLQPQSSHWLMRLTHIARERGVERVRTFLAQYGVSFLCLSDFSWVCFF